MGNRPYQDYSEAEILKAIRDLEGDLRDFSKRRARAKETRDPEDVDDLDFSIQSVNAQIRGYENELRIRREQRSTRREPRQQTGNGPPPLVPMACACRPPRRIKLTQRVFDGGPILCGVCSRPFRRA
jgi:hypothetical protein